MLVLEEVIKSFISLFIIVDPFLAVAVFISITNMADAKEKARNALLASGVALGLLIGFMFLGLLLFDFLNITTSSFIVAGGIVLLILGIQTTFGAGFNATETTKKPGAVLIGTPLLCGPGAMTTIIYLTQLYGFAAPLVASILVCAVTWVMLMFSDVISKFIGPQIIEIISRILGLVLVAIAIEFVKDGVVTFIKEYI